MSEPFDHGRDAPGAHLERFAELRRDLDGTKRGFPVGIAAVGVLGKLISDEQLAAQFDRLIQQVTGAIEDAREAAPVSTFFQVLSSPF